MNETKISLLLFRQLEGIITEEEKKTLDEWVGADPANRELFDELNSEEDLSKAIAEFHPGNYKAAKEGIWSAIENEIQQVPKLHRIHRRSWWAAAAVLIILFTGSYFLFFNNTKKSIEIVKTQTERFSNDIDPGKYKAKLTLDNGETIILDSAALGELAKQGGTMIMNKDGKLVYDVKTKTTEVLYNTLSTSKGETYATVLSDGSKVWLNAGSSIRYPVAFNGNERRVEITGEAYFEVSKDPLKPFIASVNGLEVQVLGTHFNINAYSDEATMNTTLLEGSVKVSQLTTHNSQLLKPGQQAQSSSGNIKMVNGVDVSEVVAWKEGKFDFNKTDITTLMRQLSRWYDIEVEFKGTIKEKFVANISRDKPISKVLNILELTGLVHFEIDGKKITVLP